MRTRSWFGAMIVFWLGLPGHAAAAACDDCDGDGFTKAEGDCDDGDELESPGIAKDSCGDRKDNDCNGFYDDACDLSVRQGSLSGGGGCTGNQENQAAPSTAAFLFLPLLWARRGAR